ncbi:hypothetical protein Tco_1549456 [Tanacetum coccineum]
MKTGRISVVIGWAVAMSTEAWSTALQSESLKLDSEDMSANACEGSKSVLEGYFGQEECRNGALEISRTNIVKLKTKICPSMASSKGRTIYAGIAISRLFIQEEAPRGQQKWLLKTTGKEHPGGNPYDRVAVAKQLPREKKQKVSPKFSHGSRSLFPLSSERSGVAITIEIMQGSAPRIVLDEGASETYWRKEIGHGGKRITVLVAIASTQQQPG